MAYLKESHDANYDEHIRKHRSRHTKKHNEQAAASAHQQDKRTRPERRPRFQSPRRKRIATGYIDRNDCPSNPYISRCARTPDTDYITRPPSYHDDYIQPRAYQGRHEHFHSSPRPDEPRWTVQSFASKEDFMRSHGPGYWREGETKRTRDVRPLKNESKNYGSDVEDVPDQGDVYKQGTRSRRYNSEEREGSDIVTDKKRDMGSDIASIRSRRSSHSRSDRRSIRSLAVGSDVQEKRRRSGSASASASDSEGGYISLDDHIGGGSDCVSYRSSSEDEGEGSDAVGSEVGHGSDVVDVSDVESFDEGEDRISGGSDDEIDEGDARSGIAYRAWERASRV